MRPFQMNRPQRIMLLLTLVLALPGASVRQAGAALPVTGRDWYEVVPKVFTPRSGVGGLTLGGKLWVIGGNDGRPRSDVWLGDGVAWSRLSGEAFTPRDGFAAAVFNGRMWVIDGIRVTRDYYLTTTNYTDVWSSADGVKWVQSGTPTPFSRTGHSAVAFQGKLWVIGGELKYSSGPNATTQFYNDVWASDNGKNWLCMTKNAPFSPRRGHTTVAFNNRLWVIGGYILSLTENEYVKASFNDVWSSADGVKWTSATLNAGFSPRYDLACVAFGGKLWVIGGSDQNGVKNNEIWNSTDGIHWNRITPDHAFLPRAGHACVVKGSELWVLGGADGGACHSADGIHWTEQPLNHPGARKGQANLAFGGRLWVIGGSGWDGVLRNDIWSSPDGSQWTRAKAHAAFAPLSGGLALSYQDKMWLVAGWDGVGNPYSCGKVWRSADGVNWTTVTTGKPFFEVTDACVHGGKMKIYGRSLNGHFGVWSSSNGVEWTQSMAPIIKGPCIADFHNQLWMTGGLIAESSFKPGKPNGLAGDVSYSDSHQVWSSVDESTWTLVTRNAAITGHQDSRATVFDNRIWVIGGSFTATNSSFSSDYYSDIWSSADGINWTCANAQAPFPARSGHGVALMNQRLWVLGGYNSDGSLGDVWYTYSSSMNTGANAAEKWRLYR